MQPFSPRYFNADEPDTRVFTFAGDWRDATRAARRLGILCRDAPPGPLMAPLAMAARPEIVEAVVDSGAEDSVTPPGVFPGPVVPSAMSKAGRSYRAANGSPIPNLGQTMAHFRDATGALCGIPLQVAPVERPLLSVARLAAAGCEVTFNESSGVIVHSASGRRLPLVKRGGVYILELRAISVPTPRSSPSGRKPASGFARQG